MATIHLLGFLTLSLLAQSQGAESAYELFSIGSQLELEGRTTEAIEYYTRAKSLDPGSVSITVSLASALYSAQRFDEGIAAIEDAIAVEPDNVRLYQIAALGYVGKRDLGKATEYYEEALTYAPENRDLYFAIATLLEARGEIRSAMSALERMPSDTRNVETYVRLASLAGRLNDHALAVDYYRMAYATDSTDITAVMGMAAGYDMLGVTDSATFYYERVYADTFIIDIAQRLMDLYTEKDRYDDVMNVAAVILANDPSYNHARRSLGFAFYKRGQLTESLDAFYVALRIDPADTYSAFYVARIYLEQGEYDKSLQEIRRAIKVNPDFIELWIYLGFAAIEKRDYALAEHAFTEAAYRGADRAQIYYLLGAVMETRGMDTDAYFYYKKALKADPRDQAALESLANLASRVGREDETFEVFRRILEIDTLNAVALNYVGYTLAERHDSLEYALELINRALKIDTENGYYIDSRGWVYYQMGRYDDALTELERAAGIVEDPVILEHLGDVYLKLNERDAALRAYERAAELDSGNKALRAKIRAVR